MQLQKSIFLNKVLCGVVIILIIYLGISVILIFSPKGDYKVKNATQNHEILEIKTESISSTPPQLLSYYKNVSSGRLFTPPISTPPPIFSPSKVESSPLPEKKPIVPTPEITFQLIGIVWEEGKANVLIKSSQNPETQLITIGDKISGYEIVDITPYTVILSNGSVKKVIRVEE